MGKKTKRRLSSSQILKRKVRNTTEWSQLRQLVREEQKTDPVSLRPLTRTFNLHHLSQDERFYDDLERSRFLGLNDYSHRTIHFIYDIVKREGDFQVLDRIKEIIEQMQEITEKDFTRECN